MPTTRRSRGACLRQAVLYPSSICVLAGSIAAQAPDFVPRGQYELFVDAAATTPGLTGSYVNANLGAVASPADWRTTQAIAGTRIDPKISFSSSDWQNRAALGLTGGTSQDWDSFSVQWDGFVRILVDGTTLQTMSDDSSRMWVDINNDGVFTNGTPELANNHWGTPQTLTLGDPTPPLAAGLYRIRIQYEERFFGNLMHLVPSPTVRIAYLVPSNRTASPNAVPVLRDMVNAWQSWLCDYTSRNLGAPSKLRVESDTLGVPIVHVVPVADSDAYLRVDPWGRGIAAATSAGVPVWTPGQVWFLVPLIHAMQPNGAIDGSVALGIGGGGSEAGVAMLNSIGIALAAGGGITNTIPYGGLVVPEIGSYPLVNSVSFPWFEGNTVSSVVSSYYGAGLHELAHALGIGHDWRNDDNAFGNLMFNGLRGFRGAMFPASFPDEDCRLEFASSLVLRNSRYMTPCGGRLLATGPVPVDRTPPTITSLTSGTVSPVSGLLPVTVQVADGVALSCVLLAKNGDTVEEQVVSGTSASVTFQTAWFDPGVARDYQITVYDRAGNRVQQTTTITAVAGGNRAPQPKFRVTRSEVPVNGRALLDASGSTDPEGGALTYEWDLDGNGAWTAPSPLATRVATYPTPWPRLVRVRVTDVLGAKSVSAPIAVRVRPADPSPFHTAFGAGSPGCNGAIGLHGTVQPASGSSAFAIVATNTPPSSPGLIALATQATSNCMTIAGQGPACFHFFPWTLLDVVPITSDSGGHCYLPLPIPFGLAGVQVVFQTLWVENGTCLVPVPNYATSNSLRLTLF